MSELESKAKDKNNKELVYEYQTLDQENNVLDSIFDWLFEQVENNE